MSELNEEILDKLTKVCICKGIPRSTIKRVIREGASDIYQVRYKTGAGSGPCQGRRCTPKILQILEDMTEKPQEWPEGTPKDEWKN